MKKRIGLVLTLLFVCALAGRAIWPGAREIPEVKASAGMKHKAQSNDPMNDLNEKAKSARGGDLKSVGELADDIITRYGLLESATGVKEVIRERVIRAEVTFQKNGKGGIPEQNLVLMVNELASKLGAPDFMKTDAQQVRFLRVARMSQLPNLINQPVPRGREASKGQTRSSINSEMSPLEAMFVAMDLVYQKINLDEFQVTPSEFRANLHQRNAILQQSHRRKSQSPGSIAEETTVKPEYQMRQAVPPSKSAELRQTSSRTAGMSNADSISLANSCLDTLGIGH